MLRIVADYNTMMTDVRQRIWIHTGINRELLDMLQPGLRVILSDPPDEVEAVLEADEQANGQVKWFGVPDWSTQRELPLDE